jgi:UDP-N-acetylmuramoyl-tripeptide--D-alanyl-D-alanine ligase
MRGFGQIAELCAFTRPEIGVITMIAPVHLEKVGNLEGVVRAKSELVAALPPGGTAIVPAGFVVERNDLTVIRTGEDVTLESFEPPKLVTSLGATEVSFTARHLASNALSAIAAAHALGLDLPARLDVAFAEWRTEELPLPGGGLLLNDAWNANPISMRAALEHLAALAQGRRRIAVLGEMAELGDYAAEAHREVARAVQEVGVELLVSVGPQARVYGGRSVADATEAIALLREELKPGDFVLVKGARALGLERVADSLAGVTA